MRIAIEPGSYSLTNMGDVAMLQVAVRRLRALLPLAELRVFTNDPGALRAYCPEAVAEPAAGRVPWVAPGVLLGRLHGLLPRALSRALSRARMRLGVRWPRFVVLLLALRLPRRARARFRGFVATMRGADLFLVVGQGAMGDATRGHATTVLATLSLARRYGVPTAMLGQGIGPLTDRALREHAVEVLPGVRVIGLRERVSGPALLASLGVAASRVVVTGDDAVELAYSQRRASLGAGLGLNLRVSGNAGTDESVVALVRGALRELLPILGEPPLVPAPIARGAAHDSDVIGRLVTGLDAGAGDTGTELDSPSLVIGRIADCRVLVTGAYHAAVFALAQGIPVVCLAGSPYYRDKFNGLLELFPGGGELLSVDAPDLAGQLVAAVRREWADADARRSVLLRAAAAQVAAGRAAYARVAELLSPGAGVAAATDASVVLPPGAATARLLDKSGAAAHDESSLPLHTAS